MNVSRMQRWVLAAALCLAAPAWSDELRVGDPAPAFELEGTDGRTHALSDHRGREAVVLAWFPKAYTRGCTIECKSLAENGHLIRRFEAAYYMASVDPLADNQGFAQQQNADFPLLSDPQGAVARAYGVLNASGLANRHTFYIGADGTILAIDREVRPDTSALDIAAKLEALDVPERRP